MNKSFLIGRLTRDPELRTTASGHFVTRFTLAVDRGYKNEVDFIDIVCWQKLAEIVADNLTKGRKVAVEGRIEISKYEKDGKMMKSFQVVADSVEFLDFKREPGEDTKEDIPGIDISDDDLPF